MLQLARLSQSVERWLERRGGHLCSPETLSLWVWAYLEIGPFQAERETERKRGKEREKENCARGRNGVVVMYPQGKAATRSWEELKKGCSSPTGVKDRVTPADTWP